MPLRDLAGYLWDVAEACRKIMDFTEGKTPEDYLGDELLRSAVERQLILLGEALAQAQRFFPEVEGQISEVRQIVGLRNRIVHAYLDIKDETVWRITQSHVPHLRQEAQTALSKLSYEDENGSGS